MIKRLVKHGDPECYGSGYPVENLASVLIYSTIDYSTNPPTHRTAPDGQRWICPECELTIKGEEAV